MKQRYKVEQTAFGRSYEYQVVYLTYLFMMFSYTIPFLTLIIFNTAIYVKVRFFYKITFVYQGLGVNININ